MKKLLIIFFFIFAKFATAQFDLHNPSAVTVNGGLFLPYSSEVFKTGINFGIDVQHKLDPVYLFINLSYNFSSRKNTGTNESFNNTSGTGILEVTPGVRLVVAETNLKYFIDAGLGLYIEKKGSYDIKINGITTSYPSENNVTLGGNFGFGAEYPLSKDFDFVAKIKYHLFFGIGNDPFLNTYFGINGGIKYNINF